VFLSNVTYEPFGGVRSWQAVNGEVQQRLYDTSGRLTQIAQGSFSKSFSYDANHNITAMGDGSNTSNNTNYGYDALDRLTDYNASTQSIAYIYDPNGNLASYQYNALSQRIRKEVKGNPADVNGDGVINHLDIAAANGQNAVAVDCNSEGNPANSDNGKSQGNGNAKGQDTSCIAKQIGNNPNSPNTQTGSGVSGSAGNKVSYFVYDEAGQLLAEHDDMGAPVSETVYLYTIPVAVIQQGVVYTVHTDQLDTPRAISDPQGVTVWRWEGEPFGATLADEDPDGDGVKFVFNGRFAGQYYDAETGLYYNYYRYYDPATGRYVTSDPVGLYGGLNTYSYVGNNPMGWIDPYGLCKQDVENVRKWIEDHIGIEQSENWEFGDATEGGKFPTSDAYYHWRPWRETTVVDNKYKKTLTVGDMMQLVETMVHESLHKKHYWKDMWDSTWDWNWQDNHQLPYKKETHDLIDPVLQKGVSYPEPCECENIDAR